MAAVNAIPWDYIESLLTMGIAAPLAGAFVGGVIFSLTSKVWTHVADRLAEKLDAKRAEQVQRLQAECWRLRARAAGKAA